MPNNIAELTCPRCGHTWTEDVAGLRKPDSTIYRGENPAQRVETLSVHCPICTTRVTFDWPPQGASHG
jgi:hypothetical protein